MYADDTKLYGDPTTSYQILQNDLNHLYKWCCDWLLPLNTDKCVVLHMGRNNPCYNYIINNTELTSVDYHQDLGITITNDLSWSLHISNICKRANTALFLLKKVFPNASLEIFSKLYKIYVRPIIEFNGSVWHPNTIRDLNLIESVQRRATRLPFGPIRPTYQERLVTADLTSVETRRLRGDLIITYRALHNELPIINHLFTLNPDERLRNHGYKLQIDNFQSSVRQKFLVNRVFHVWNSLPVDVVSASSVSIFKRRLDKWIKSGDMP